MIIKKVREGDKRKDPEFNPVKLKKLKWYKK